MKYILSAALAVFLAMPVLAAELGDPAPDLNIAEWIKGDSVNIDTESDNIYVVEFWATWCPPCRESIPHLTELQEKFKNDNVVIIGVSDEDAATVKPFVEDMGGKMDYHVAVDDGQKTHENYMYAYNQTGIPTAFVVDKQGRIAWYGHPMMELESVLEQLVAGDYDVAEAKETMKKQQQIREELQEFAQFASTGASADDINARAKTILEGDHYPEVKANVGWIIMNNESIENPDYALAKQLIEPAITSENDGVPPPLYHMYAAALFGLGEKEAAIEQQTKAVELAEPGDMQNFFSQTLNEYKQGGGEGS